MLPDSGGEHYDADQGGVSGVAERWYSGVKSEILSGDAASTAVGFAAGMALVGAAERISGAFE